MCIKSAYLKDSSRLEYADDEEVNSDVEVHCCDGQVDRIMSCDKNTKLKIHTNEYCDKYFDNSSVSFFILTNGKRGTRIQQDHSY